MPLLLDVYKRQELMETQEELLDEWKKESGLQKLVETFAANIGADIFVIDASGTCIAGSYESSGLTHPVRYRSGTGMYAGFFF